LELYEFFSEWGLIFPKFQTNIFNSINNASPNVEGMTAISAWMLACMFFIFGALLGYASILYFLLVRLTTDLNE